MKFRLGMLAAALAVVAIGWAGSSKPTAAVSAPVKYNLAGPEIEYTDGGVTKYMVPRGSFKFTDDTFDRRVLVTIYGTKLSAGTVLTVRHTHGSTETVLGTITLSAYGSGRLFMSQDFGDVIPDVVDGDDVEITTGAGAGLTVRLHEPRDYKYFQMFAKPTGPAVEGKAPTGRVTYKERDYGFTRSVRLFGQNINRIGEELVLYKGADTETDLEIGRCTVSAARLCIINIPAMHDDDDVSTLGLTSVLKLRMTDEDETVVATMSGWTQVVPVPTP